MVGIYLVDGMSLKISNLTFSIGVNDDAPSAGPTIEVAYDACVAWAKIALVHRAEALECMSRRKEIWKPPLHEDENDLRGLALQSEFHSSMQAVVAACICLDALYDRIKPYASISSATRDAWTKKGTARHAQVMETLRVAFKLPDSKLAGARDALKAIYALRDSSVHPSSQTAPPRKHPDLEIATDWRLCTGRGDVADILVCTVTGMLWEISRVANSQNAELSKFIKEFRGVVDRLLPDGKLTPLCREVSVSIPPMRNRGR